MDQVFQALIDRSRVLLYLQTVKTILGHQRRPKFHWRKKNSAQWEVAVEKPAYDLTIFKLHCGKLTLKIYTKGERVLRIEVVVHNNSATAMWPLTREVSPNPDAGWIRANVLLVRLYPVCCDLALSRF
jgi:hypothetical protein